MTLRRVFKLRVVPAYSTSRLPGSLTIKNTPTPSYFPDADSRYGVCFFTVIKTLEVYILLVHRTLDRTLSDLRRAETADRFERF